MFFPGLDKITDKISDIRDAVAPVTTPIGDAFNAAVDGARDTVRTGRDAVTSSASAVASVGGALLDRDARPLNTEERALAESYFGDSIDLDKITLNQSSALVAANEYFPGNNSSRPFVLGNTINFNHDLDLNDPDDRGIFLHELTHVWQFQSTEGINTQIQGAQLATDSDNYVIDTALLDPNNPENIHDFNIEQQAETVRGHFLLTEHERLSDLASNPSLTSEERRAVQEDLDFIEGQRLYNNLNDNGITAENLEPFLDEIQSFKPREGVVAEANEAVYEIVDDVLGFNPLGAQLEVAEGAVEIGREAGEVVLEKTGEAIIDGATAADEAFSDIKDLFTGRIPRPF